MSANHDPGDEHVDIVQEARDRWPEEFRRRVALINRLLPIDPEAERMVDAAIAAQQPVATSRRLLRPRR